MAEKAIQAEIEDRVLSRDALWEDISESDNPYDIVSKRYAPHPFRMSSIISKGRWNQIVHSILKPKFDVEIRHRVPRRILLGMARGLLALYILTCGGYLLTEIAISTLSDTLSRTGITGNFEVFNTSNNLVTTAVSTLGVPIGHGLVPVCSLLAGIIMLNWLLRDDGTVASRVTGRPSDRDWRHIVRAVRIAGRSIKFHSDGISSCENRSSGTNATDLREDSAVPEESMCRVLSDMHARIDGVKEALAHLELEWLNYELDTEAYFLHKPALRDHGITVVENYHTAMYHLREVVSTLDGKYVGEFDVADAESAADRALSAWGDATDYAERVGIDDRSPIEKVALRRLHKRVVQLADPGTPRESWSSLIGAIDRELGKLTTVPVPWRAIISQPSIGDEMHMMINARAEFPELGQVTQ